MANTVLITLDDEAYRIWMSLARGSRSRGVAEMLKATRNPQAGLQPSPEEEEEANLDSPTGTRSRPPDSSSGSTATSKTPESASSEMESTTLTVYLDSSEKLPATAAP